MYQRRQFARKSAKRRGGNKQHTECPKCWKSAMDSKRALELRQPQELQEQNVVIINEITTAPELSRTA